MTIWPGFGDTSPPMPTAPEPLPKREDPSLAEARERQRLAEKRRRGRAASILTEEEDRLGSANVSRPEARSSRVLG